MSEHDDDERIRQAARDLEAIDKEEIRPYVVERLPSIHALLHRHPRTWSPKELRAYDRWMERTLSDMKRERDERSSQIERMYQRIEMLVSSLDDRVTYDGTQRTAALQLILGVKRKLIEHRPFELPRLGTCDEDCPWYEDES